MPSSRDTDQNGYMTVNGCPLSSFGIFDYSAAQVGLDGDPMRIVKVLRPESALTDPEAIASFMNVPLIDGHAMLGGTNDSEDEAPEDKGIDGILTSNVYWESPWLRGDLRIFSRKMKSELQRGKKDLSLGYSCDFEHKPGVWNGQPYEVIQTNMRGNHIALVGSGRVNGARILDGLCFDHLSLEPITSKGKPNMGTKTRTPQRAKVVAAKTKVAAKAQDSATEELQKLIPALSAALQQFMQEEAKEPEHNDDTVDPADPTANLTTDDDSDDVDQGQGEEQDVAAAIEGATEEVEEATEEVEGAAEQIEEEGTQADVDGANAADPDAVTQPTGVNSLITQVEQLLASLKSMAEGSSKNDVEAQEKAAAAAEDSIDGLKPIGDEQDDSDEAEDAAACDDGKPNDENKAKAVAKKAEDAALGRFYSDLARKSRHYDRVSSLVGAFDHSHMDAAQVCAYGVKKLGIKCADGAEEVALNAYLDGVAATRAKVQAKRKAVADSALNSSAEMDAYLNGSK